MTKNCLIATAFLLAASTAAHAGGQAGSIGVGAEYELNGIGGVSVNYDAGQFHIGGFLSFSDPTGPNNTLFEVGGRFFWHVHKTAMSDFGVGGGLGIASIPPGMGGGNNRATALFLEPGFQIRLFVASNVALSFTAGLTLGRVDVDSFAVTGQAQGIAGVHYYFF